MTISLLVACGGSSNPSNITPRPIVDKVTITFDFNQGIDDWIAGFADYPIGEEFFYELSSNFEQLPSPLENQSGFFLSGNNHSDDLFMFIKKSFTNFKPNSRYQIQFEITFATNAPKNCAGAGGPPGEGVIIKAGASVIEPLAMNNGSGSYLMNIDKGNQSVGGSDAMVIGDFSNSKNCGMQDFSYELKTLNNDGNLFTVQTSDSGTLWMTFSTDSGFESTTGIYYLRGKIVSTEF